MGTLSMPAFTNHRRAAHNRRQQELRAQRAPDPMGPDRTCRTCGTRWICGTRRAYGARWTRWTRWTYGTRWTRDSLGLRDSLDLRGSLDLRDPLGLRDLRDPLGQPARPDRRARNSFRCSDDEVLAVLFARAARPTERNARLPAPQQRGYV